MTPILILPLEGAKFNPRVCSMNHKERGPGKALLTRPTGERPARVAGDKLSLHKCG